MTTAMDQETAKVRERTALPYEVVDHEVLSAGGYRTLEDCRADHALPARCTGVVYNVCLNDSDLDIQIQSFREQFCERSRNPIEPLILLRVNRNKQWPPVSNQPTDRNDRARIC